MFRGINALNIDAKGRVGIPSRYRPLLLDEFEGRIVLTIDTEEPALLLYPLNEWENIERKLEALPSFNAQARRIQRLLIGHATEVEMDGQGRLLLPNLLRDYAQLDKKVILLGQGKKFELWSEGIWQDRRATWLAETNNDDSLPDELQSLSL